MKYQQLTEGDRYMIVALKRHGLSFTNIAKAIGKHRSTIYREFKRNTCWHQYGSFHLNQSRVHQLHGLHKVLNLIYLQRN